jgi:hypothetical protein
MEGMHLFHLVKLGGALALIGAVVCAVIAFTHGPPVTKKLDPRCSFGCATTVDSAAVSQDAGLVVGGLLGGALLGAIATQFLILVGVPKEMLGAEGMFD